MAVSALTCAAAIDTDIKIDVGRLPAAHLKVLSHFLSLTFPLCPPSPHPSQCPPSPQVTCRQRRSTRQRSVSLGQPPTLSSSMASTRATRSVQLPRCHQRQSPPPQTGVTCVRQCRDKPRGIDTLLLYKRWSLFTHLFVERSSLCYFSYVL